MLFLLTQATKFATTDTKLYVPFLTPFKTTQKLFEKNDLKERLNGTNINQNQ